MGQSTELDISFGAFQKVPTGVFMPESRLRYVRVRR